MDKKKYINFLFRRIEPDYLKQLLERELSDQVPCFFKNQYGEKGGLTKYHHTVIDSVSDFVFYSYTKFDEATDYEEEEGNIKTAINILLTDDIIKYYKDADCSEYVKQDMFESENSKPHKETINRLRRLQELRDSIDFQTEIHDPCNFDDGEEYADFCINEGLSFFYGDEGYDDDYNENYDITDTQEEREEVEKLMYDEYFDMLSEAWEESNC
jgi:hypothetical protein